MERFVGGHANEMLTQLAQDLRQSPKTLFVDCCAWESLSIASIVDFSRSE